MKNMPRKPVLAVLAAITILASLSSTLPSEGTGSSGTLKQARPLCRVDLRPLGWREPKGLNYARDFLAFPEKNVLVVGFARSNTSGKPIGSLPQPGQLDTAFFEAQTGQLLMTRGWSYQRSGELWAGPAGRLLVRADGGVRSYSANLDELGQHSIGRDWDKAAYVRLSPSGRSLLAYPFGYGQVDVIATDTWEVRASWNEDKVWVVSLTDSQVAGHVVKDRNQAESLIRKLGEDWRPVTSAAPRGCDMPEFLTDRALVLTGSKCNRVFLVNDKGEVLLADELGHKDFVATHAYPSRDGRRFAVLVEKWKGVTMEFLDMYAHTSPEQVVVYDLDTHRRVYDLKTNLLSKLGLQVALSSDGSLLAISAGGIVEVYQLP